MAKKAAGLECEALAETPGRPADTNATGSCATGLAGVGGKRVER